jgi:hypothetical protein
LSDYPQLRIIEHINTETHENSVILSLKPADMYYANRRMVSYLDPRLIELYSTQDPQHALEELTALGITHIHAVDYGLPVFANSVLQYLMSDAALTTLLFQADGNQLYQLSHGTKKTGTMQNLRNGEISWHKTTKLELGGRKALLGIESNAVELFVPTQLSEAAHFGGLFHRHLVTTLSAGNCEKGAQNRISVRGGEEYVVSFNVEGYGYVRFLLEQFHDNMSIKDASLNSRHSNLLGEVILGGSYKRRQFVRRFKALPEATRIELTVEHVGMSSVMVHEATVTELVNTK